jgi:hypothetical protein
MAFKHHCKKRKMSKKKMFVEAKLKKKLIMFFKYKNENKNQLMII